MVGYEGEKMSKSLGNLVLVSHLVAGGADPRAIRLALLAHHYREDWEWTDDQLGEATERLARWVEWAKDAVDGEDPFVDRLRGILSLDLDTPGAIEAIDERLAEPAIAAAVTAIDALLGLDLLVE